MNNKISLFILAVVTCIGGLIVATKQAPAPTPQPQPKGELVQPVQPVPIPTPKQLPSSYNISPTIPSYLNYEGVKKQLDDWHRQAPEITEVGSYGKSSAGRDIYYFNVTAPTPIGFERTDIKVNNGHSKPRVLITACIHGDEHIANATVMGIVGNYLQGYGRDEKITKLIRERDVYFVPVVSPDSFVGVSRHVDGVDPNRNFPYPGNVNVRSVPPVDALRRFHLEKKFDAAMSGHAFGRVIIYPFGHTKSPSPDDAKFKEIAGKMGQLTGYRPTSISGIQTAPPYHGFEADWFYYNGCFAMVTEFGQTKRPPASDIAPEVQKTFRAFVLFIEEAPLVKVNPPALR